jgi:hypothetical protein
MDRAEFVVALTGSRHFGKVFLPFLIQKKDNLYSIERQVKKHDLEHAEYAFKSYEKELVELIDKYSEERLRKRFSKTQNYREFQAGLTPEYLQRYIVPYVEECMHKIASILMLSPVRLFYKEGKYPNIYDEDEIDIQPLFAKPVFHFERKETETRYRLRIYLDQKEIPLQNRNIEILTNNPCLILYQKKLIAFEKLDAKKLIPFFSKEYISVPRSFEEKYYPGFIRKSIREYEVKADGFILDHGKSEKFASLTLENTLEMKPALLLRFHYEDESFLPNAKRETAVKCYKNEGNYIFRKIKRDFVWEKSITDQIKKTGLVENNGYYALPGTRLLESKDFLYLLINWLNKNKPQLSKKGIKLIQGKLDKTYFTGQQELQVKTRLTDDWFDVYATVSFGEFSFPFIRLKNHILNHIRELELPNGETAVIPEEWFARYESLMPFARRKGKSMQVGKHHYTLLQQILEPADKHALNKFQKLYGTQQSVSLPEGLNAEMRAYQMEGYRWMFGLNKNGFGGCLADDMGLGKTLQTLTLLLKFKRHQENSQFPEIHAKDGQLMLFSKPVADKNFQPASLIILPTSLVHNWESEIHKFTPSLKVYKHAGPQRKTNEEMESAASLFDVILTTYGTVRNDQEILSKLKFFYLILDESQYIKNPTSKTYKAIMKLRGEHRLVLTGTPIENSLSDLWAQMNFLNRGMLGNLAFFRRFFITPIEKHHMEKQREKLQTLIRPFILRRTKEEVANDLPPLMEQVVVCEMEEKQGNIYEKEKSIIRNSILAGIEKDGVVRSAMIILKGLTRLRQLANHPLLLNDRTGGNSGKYEEIIRMLENVVTEKHKVLVFSSFVRHLELIRKGIEKENWKYSILTGQTTNRGGIIRQFQDDPENHIFLISLKAGGVGLNLTSADYVFILDPWWNPASENQAVSRAHRIGQNKHVFVYRFITQGSIEEKIQQLQERKSALANKFIHSNNPLMEASKEEILNLLM